MKTDLDLNQNLEIIVLEMQAMSPQSLIRHRKFKRFYHMLCQSGRLIRPMIRSAYGGAYDEIYEIALQRLFCDLHRQLDRYDPGRGTVLQWVNYLLKVRFSDAINEVIRVGRGDRFAPMQRVEWQDWHNDVMSDSCSLYPDDGLPTIHEVRDYINTDCHQVLGQITMPSAPHVTFQWLLMCYLDGYSWRELADAIAVPLPTLSSFFYRTLKRVIPHFQQVLMPTLYEQTG